MLENRIWGCMAWACWVTELLITLYCHLSHFIHSLHIETENNKLSTRFSHCKLQISAQNFNCATRRAEMKCRVEIWIIFDCVAFHQHSSPMFGGTFYRSIAECALSCIKNLPSYFSYFEVDILRSKLLFLIDEIHFSRRKSKVYNLKSRNNKKIRCFVTLIEKKAA